MDQFLVLVRGILSHILGKKEGHDLPACYADVRTSRSCVQILQSHWRQNIKVSVDLVNHICYSVAGIDLSSTTFSQQIIGNEKGSAIINAVAKRFSTS